MGTREMVYGASAEDTSVARNPQTLRVLFEFAINMGAQWPGVQTWYIGYLMKFVTQIMEWGYKNNDPGG